MQNTDNINVFISGDFAPINRINDLIVMNEYDKIYNDILPVIRESDISITNLELPLIEGGTPLSKTGPNLKAPSESINALKYAGFNLVTLANNHIMDYGTEGLKSTIRICKDNDIDFVGAGESYQEAKQVKIIESKGKKIAFINVAENEWSTTYDNSPGTNPLDEAGVYYQIREAKNSADYVILIIHGGHETYELPSPNMKKLYRYFVDLGVDAVVGHHTHCFSGFEIYNSKPIFYSLGNFIFDFPNRRNNSSWNKGFAVNLILENGKIDFKMHLFYQNNERVGIQMFNLEEIEKFNIENQRKTEIIQSDQLLKSEFDKFLIKQEKAYLSLLEPTNNKYILAIMNRGWFPRIINKYQSMLLLNIIRCESHREIVINTLSKRKHQ